jgi:hypothetical protein
LESTPGGSASEIEDQDDERSVCRPKHFKEGHFFTSVISAMPRSDEARRIRLGFIGEIYFGIAFYSQVL